MKTYVFVAELSLCISIQIEIDVGGAKKLNILLEFNKLLDDSVSFKLYYSIIYYRLIYYIIILQIL